MTIKIETSDMRVIPFHTKKINVEMEIDGMGIDDLLSQLSDETLIDHLESKSYNIYGNDQQGIDDMIDFLTNEGYNVERK